MAASKDASDKSLYEAIRLGAVNGDASRVYNLAKDSVALGADRKALVESMTRLMLELRNAGNEPAENIVTDTMDCLVGWCGPSARI
ncbi:MAG: hypothetical protein ABMA14_06430 [Hyphomonadaceae bacterium]